MNDSEIAAKIDDIIAHAQRRDHPLLLANHLSYLISDLMRANGIALYTAYQLEGYVLALNRLGYTKPAYPHKAQISTFLECMNLKLLAHIFDEAEAVERYREFALESARLNVEKRAHYIMDHGGAFLEVQQDQAALEKLKEIRAKGRQKKIDHGPYHDESFPWTHFNIEEALLRKLSDPNFKVEKPNDARFDELIVALELADY